KAKDLDLWHIILNGDFPPLSKNEVTQILEEYERIFMCKMAKVIWKSLLITHQGNSQVKDNKIDLLVQQYEQFTILEEESIDSGFARFNIIIISLEALDEESKDLSSLALDELIGNLKKEFSDDETSTSGSDNEEYGIAVRNFKKLFRRKGKYVRQPREKGSHSDKGTRRKERVTENVLDAMIQFISLAIVQKHLATKIKRLSLEVLGAIARMTPKTKPMTKLVSWQNRQMRCFLGYSQSSKAYVVLNKHTIKVEELLNVTFDESLPPTKLSPLIDDVAEEDAIRKNTKIVNTNNEEDESIEVEEIVNIRESKNHPLDQVIGNLNQRTLRSQA
nr:UBN2 domain-containing protein [Tanacetum cinerariifolium]